MPNETKGVVPAFEQGHEQHIIRPAVLASESELKEMRDRKRAVSLRKVYGGRIKRFRVSGEPRTIL